MFKIKVISIFAINVIFLLLSWAFYLFPHGDEYLMLFVIPLICIVAPYVLTLRMMAFLLAGNFLFFVFYSVIGILNAVDVAVLMSLLVASSGISYMCMMLSRTFERFNRADVAGEEDKYNRVVRELENGERKGRTVEKELSRISRLYKITKQLESVLRFDDLFDALFDFLENNFQFGTAHLLVFNDGKFSQGVSKSVLGDRMDHGKRERKGPIDYKALVGYMGEKDFKSFYLDRKNAVDVFDSIGVRADTFLAFPLFVKKISAILAIEGATKMGYNKINIIIPQIALELRKVELYEQVEKLSIIDGLTGVYLRRYLIDRLMEEVDRARRLELTFSIGMIDIDHFKRCNDEYGHLAGDAVLREVAERLKFSVREVDMVARYGGEEFCVILPETTKKLAVIVAERLRKSVESAEVKTFEEKINTTISIGIATYPENGKDVTSLIEAADTALYKAKHKGRNRVCTA